jgi:hypothetical protein
MKTIYTIIYAGTKPQYDEKIGVGLLCMAGNELYFHFSKAKLTIISGLLEPAAKKMLLTSLKSMETYLIQVQEGSGFLGHQDPLVVTENYISYLHRYSHNLIQFSAPRTMDVSMNRSDFELFFQETIFRHEDFEDVKQKTGKPLDYFRKTLKPTLIEYVNTDFEVTSDFISTLVTPVSVDLFGKNGAYVAGQSFDFSKQYTELKKEVNAFMYLTTQTESIDKAAKCFVIGEEPAKAENRNHQLWKILSVSGTVEFVPLNELDRIEDYLIRNDVKPVV